MNPEVEIMYEVRPCYVVVKHQADYSTGYLEEQTNIFAFDLADDAERCTKKLNKEEAYGVELDKDIKLLDITDDEFEYYSYEILQRKVRKNRITPVVEW